MVSQFFSEYVLERLPQDNTVLFTIQFGLLQDLVEKLLDNQIDCAIATQKIAKAELEYQLIFEENFWLIGSPQSFTYISGYNASRFNFSSTIAKTAASDCLQ